MTSRGSASDAPDSASALGGGGEGSERRSAAPTEAITETPNRQDGGDLETASPPAHQPHLQSVVSPLVVLCYGVSNHVVRRAFYRSASVGSELRR